MDYESAIFTEPATSVNRPDDDGFDMGPPRMSPTRLSLRSPGNSQAGRNDDLSEVMIGALRMIELRMEQLQLQVDEFTQKNTPSAKAIEVPEDVLTESTGKRCRRRGKRPPQSNQIRVGSITRL